MLTIQRAYKRKEISLLDYVYGKAEEEESYEANAFPDENPANNASDIILSGARSVPFLPQRRLLKSRKLILIYYRRTFPRNLAR